MKTMRNFFVAFESACRAGFKAFRAQYRRRRTQLATQLQEQQS